MTCLHMIASLPSSAAFKRALASAAVGDTLLLCEDAVYADTIDTDATVVVMWEDVLARGIDSPFVRANYDTLVELVCRHDKQIHWG
jgi:sulfur relay protein TusB/DsrH